MKSFRVAIREGNAATRHHADGFSPHDDSDE
jgi:hypothetical protein